MPVTPTPVPTPPSDPELVARIAEILLSADDDPGVAEAAWLVRVEPVAEPAAADADDHAGASTSSEAAVLSGLDLGLVALDAASGHPADLLRGFVAPPEWWAIGVIASGRAHAVPPDLVGPELDVRRRHGPCVGAGSGAPRPPRDPQRAQRPRPQVPPHGRRHGPPEHRSGARRPR
jgi:hypothetical protein